jgi:hypothetical protein
VPDGGPAWWPTASRMRRTVLMAAAGAMLLQAVLVLALPTAPPGWAVWVCVGVSLAAACALWREARRAGPELGIRAVSGRLEVLEPDGAVRAAMAVLATSPLVVLRLEGGAARFLDVWRDALPAAEFRRLVTAARWSRPSGKPLSAV